MHKNKALVSLVLGLSIILVGGLGLLGYGLYKRVSNPDFKFFTTNNEKPAKTSKLLGKASNSNGELPTNISIRLAKGEWVIKIALSDGNIIAHVTSVEKRDRFLIIDAETGAIMRQIRFDHSP
jgi:hypothetical protein